MGIINVTPDSFSDGGTNDNIDKILKKVGYWIELGVDIIDVGGESTRPGSDSVSEELEIERTSPVIESIIRNFPQAFVSIDTMKFSVAEAALQAGAKMINDVSGLTNNPDIADLAAEYSAELVIMHLPDSPKTMQIAPVYQNLISDVFSFLKKQIKFAQSKGVKKVYADVGIGFGKTADDNWELLRNIEEFHKLGVPLLLGVSRKRFIGELLELQEPKDRDTATMMLHSMLLGKSIDIIRVHNVESAIQMRKMYDKLKIVP